MQTKFRLRPVPRPTANGPEATPDHVFRNTTSLKTHPMIKSTATSPEKRICEGPNQPFCWSSMKATPSH
jgi:hypothetical protein